MPHYNSEELLILESPFLEIQRKMDIILLIGATLMEYGANSNQVHRDMVRVAAYLGIPCTYINIHIAYSTIMLNIHGDNRNYTAFRTLNYKGANMKIISYVSRLTWRALHQHYTLTELEKHLDRVIHKKPPYNQWLTMICAGFACGAFPILFGGSVLSAWITTICAILGFYVRDLLAKHEVNGYMSIAFAAFVASSIAFLSHSFFDMGSVIYAMISCTLFMVPGIPLINTVDDLLHNYIVSGITRATHTLLIVGSMTVGIAMSQYFNNSSSLAGAYDFAHLSIIPEDISPVLLGAAVVGAVGYAVMFFTPKRLLPIIGIGGLLAVLIKNALVIYMGYSIIGATFIAAAILSVLTLKVAKFVHASSMVLAIPSAIPLVPGVFLYRFIFEMLQINHLTPAELVDAMQSGVTAVLIIIAISVGIAAPNVLIGKFLDKSKNKQLQEYLNHRKQ